MFVEFLQLCSHLLKKLFVFVWESADLVMSWHPPSSNMTEREHPFFTRPPYPLILKNCPPLLQKIRFFSEPPIIKLKLTKFLVKLSQFKFLVNTDKNIFVYKFFVWNISDFSLFFMQKLAPRRKRGWGEVHYFRSIRITC